MVERPSIENSGLAQGPRHSSAEAINAAAAFEAPILDRKRPHFVISFVEICGQFNMALPKQEKEHLLILAIITKRSPEQSLQTGWNFQATAAVFKEAGYKSAETYLVLKLIHVE
ncbi:unnamed protein product, partial [Symbiodinium microadriaticum]